MTKGVRLEKQISFYEIRLIMQENVHSKQKRLSGNVHQGQFTFTVEVIDLKLLSILSIFFRSHFVNIIGLICKVINDIIY